MQISLLQLNLYANTYKEQLFPYLRENDFDVLLFQEITGPNSRFGNIVSLTDNYQELLGLLQETHHNNLLITERFSNDPQAYLANAIFYKKDFALLSSKEVFMNKRAEPFPADSKEYQKLNRAILAVQLKREEREITFATTHFAWGGTTQEKVHQTQQGEILVDYLKTLPKPFVFTADMNLDPQQPVIQKIDQYTRNLIAENKITNTLNPNTHSAHQMFPAGAAVDYIFVSDDITVKEFTVVTYNLSDHFGLRTEITI